MDIVQEFKTKLKLQRENAREQSEQEKELDFRRKGVPKELERLLNTIDVSDDKYFHSLKSTEEQLLYLQILNEE